MQTTLFGAPAATNGFRDSSFAKNKNLPLHRWVAWIAGFSADFVEDCVNRYLPEKDSECWVLDPFAGVGTTLVESYLAGLNVVGFEINIRSRFRLLESYLHYAHDLMLKYQDTSSWS